MSDSIPPMTRATSQVGAVTLEEVVDHLVIQVDRIKQGNKLLKLIAGGALSAAIGAAIVAGKALYGMGLGDGATMAQLQRCQQTADEDRADIREIQRIMFFRRSDAAAGSGSGLLTPPNSPRSVP